MPGTSKSTVLQPNTKPNNVFYIWYSELCRRLNSNPASVVKPVKTKCTTILDFPADRLKFEDWSPVINALRHDTSLHVINIRSKIGSYQFLHEVDTEDKARRMKRKYGSLWTDFILNSLVRALSYSVKNTQVLTCLELDGLPMFSQYLESLLKALRKNSTIKTFSLTNCPIGDIGCHSVCTCVQFMPNVEVLNLSRCELTSESGIYIAKLIKYQQLNRYTTSWHNSLRYEEPDAGNMFGVKRITLNCNPAIGNRGLNYILEELEDDLWIKALDMQKCGITEEISVKLLDILEYNRSLEIADFRQNELLSQETMERILIILKDKQSYEGEPQYNWCSTVLSLASSRSQSLTTPNRICNSLSAAPKQITNNRLNSYVKDVRKTRTVANALSKTINNCEDSTVALERDIPKQKIQQLHIQLKEEMTKRKETEKKNVELKRKLSRINPPNDQIGHGMTFKAVIKAIEKLQPQPSRTPMLKEHSYDDNLLSQTHVTQMNGFVKNESNTKNDLTSKQNGYTATNMADSACNLFEKLLLSRKEVEDHSVTEGNNLINYYYNEGANLRSVYENSEKYLKSDVNEMTESQISLFNFMEELKNDQNSLTLNFKGISNKKKYHYKGNYEVK